MHGEPIHEAIRAATGLRPDEYLHKMESPSLESDTRGGFLEATLLVREFKVPMLVFEECESGFRCFANIRCKDGAFDSNASIVWTGAHYDRLAIASIDTVQALMRQLLLSVRLHGRFRWWALGGSELMLDLHRLYCTLASSMMPARL